MSQFEFLQREWPAVCDAAANAETSVHADARTACFHARRALELAVAWLYKHDAALKLPYQDNLSALIHDPSFKLAAIFVAYLFFHLGKYVERHPARRLGRKWLERRAGA